jgi:predicted dehydrogenase
MPNLRSIVIGLGTHAQRGHLDHFHDCGIDVVAAVDTNADARERFRTSYTNPENG